MDFQASGDQSKNATQKKERSIYICSSRSTELPGHRVILWMSHWEESKCHKHYFSQEVQEGDVQNSCLGTVKFCNCLPVQLACSEFMLLAQGVNGTNPKRFLLLLVLSGLHNTAKVILYTFFFFNVFIWLHSILVLARGI